MKKSLPVLVLTLGGCAFQGTTAPNIRVRFVVTGVGASPSHAEEASQMFDQVLACADAPGAEPEGVEVVLTAPAALGVYPSGQAAIRCPGHEGLVGGCMVGPRKMLVLDWHGGPGWSESFGHESVHLARLLVSPRGDSDPGHKGPWWVGGRACQANLHW